jgi:hypothetical protein
VIQRGKKYSGVCRSDISPGITEGWDLSLLPQRPDGYSGGHPKRLIYFDSSLPDESCCLAAPESCGIAEARRSWTRQCVSSPEATYAHAARAELVDTHGLFASLVWHQVRPRERSAVDARHPTRSSPDSKTGPVLVGASDVGSPSPLRSAQAVAANQAHSLVSFPGPIETLFSQLAWRRLRSLATEERS